MLWETKAQRNDKCEKVQVCCGTKIYVTKEMWQMWKVQACCGTMIYVAKRNVLKHQKGAEKEMYKACDKKKCVDKTRNVLENRNDKCESASVLWH